MKMKRKILSLILALACLASIGVMPASANTSDTISTGEFLISREQMSPEQRAYMDQRVNGQMSRSQTQGMQVGDERLIDTLDDGTQIFIELTAMGTDGNELTRAA